ncbi:MAG: BrnT family toxin [Candidatus Thermofonsia Clade 3 bacterium]|uniref:BrnT family toxin n=1 Tax=Candidatus Thermofonsia Clade 3 bacterium TaxID=2364212 RepID=A0A2M8Q9K2_9CHLR|nr:MAG: BrnT family toxin [Candidatus Thermofonsia Clade 3 bacterium]
MVIEFDEAKRVMTLQSRGLDFAHAGEVFEGPHFTAEDLREDYGEPRFITAGWLDGRMVVLVWTPRGEARRIISMRKANEREQERFARHWARS